MSVTKGCLPSSAERKARSPMGRKKEHTVIHRLQQAKAGGQMGSPRARKYFHAVFKRRGPTSRRKKKGSTTGKLIRSRQIPAVGGGKLRNKDHHLVLRGKKPSTGKAAASKNVFVQGRGFSPWKGSSRGVRGKGQSSSPEKSVVPLPISQSRRIWAGRREGVVYAKRKEGACKRRLPKKNK